jgi:iron complex transport system ATP-binding protein
MTGRVHADYLSFSYEPGRPVFTDVSATFVPGEVTGVVGPNGAGKSTLLRVLCGLLKPQRGRVLLNGSPVSALGHLERARQVAFLPQAVNPTFSFNVFEVVCLGRYPHVGALHGLGKRDKDIVEQCLHDTGTESLQYRDFMTLSGGERQRVLIASILAQEPQVLLLDEPTSALDIHHQIEIFALLRRLVRQGYTVVVVTHDLNLAGRFCDHLLLLSCRGRLLAYGPPEQVLIEDVLSSAYAARIRVCEHPLTHTPLVSAETAEETSV